MTLDAGTRLGPYDLQSRLGGGGMGEVWKAYDPKLQRTVAIKVLHETDDAASRILAEARAASALNHPHICTIHEVGESDGTSFIVMEHVEGKPLSELIPSDGLPPESVIRYGTQIADALAHAHEHGIVHRDLKSANVVITPEAQVKLIDFSIAVPLSVADADAVTKTMESPVSSAPMGTLAYMAPEVLNGQAATARSDIWSLGVLLYEMASGRLPFEGETATEVVAGILKEPPGSLSRGVPSGLRSIVERCLSKESGRRYASGGAAQAALETVQASEPTVTASPPEPPPDHRRWRLTVAVVALAAVSAVGSFWFRSPPGDAMTTLVPQLANPVQVTNALGVEDYPSWSPDGQFLAFAATTSGHILGGDWDVFVVQPGSGPPVNRTPDSNGWDSYPSWSPDGRQIAFWSSRDGGGCFVMPALGGVPRQLMESAVPFPTNPAWSSSGDELACVTSDAEIEVVSLSTGERRRQALGGGETGGRFGLAWSHDGETMAYSHLVPMLSQANRVWAQRLGGALHGVTGEIGNSWSPSWSPDDRLLFFASTRGGIPDLWAQSMIGGVPSDRLPAAVSNGLEIRQAVLSSDGRRLAYAKGRRVANVWRVPVLDERPATWTDAEQTTFDHAFVEHVALSRDGERLLVSSDRSGNPDIWLLPSGGGEPQQVTQDPAPDWAPAWSPIDDRVAFYTYREGNRDLWLTTAHGGPASPLTTTEGADVFPVWSPDGTQLAFQQGMGLSGALWIMPSSGGSPRRLTRDGTGLSSADWSPDGAFIAYAREPPDSVGIFRVAVETGEEQSLAEFGVTPRWRTDDQVVFVGSGEHQGQLFMVDLSENVVRAITEFEGKRGALGPQALATDGDYVYFTWEEDLGDIWVMDVEWDEE